MNKQTLIKELSLKTKLTLVESKNAIDNLLNIIIETLKRGDSINISNFGSFKLMERKSRLIYNPKTKQMNRIKARRIAVFRIGKKLKEIGV